MVNLSRSQFLSLALASGAAFTLAGCAKGESAAGTESSAAGAAAGGTLNIDYATYNPLSLVIKEKGWLEAALKADGITVKWLKSAGSNKANEALRANAIDVGSTAGSAALLARANGSPIKVIDIYSQPEWAAIVVGKDSPIKDVKELKGKNIAATRGTDPYFFLLQALETAGLTVKDVTVQNLQHADGWAALQNGSVDAWAGLDPIMAGAETKGAKLLYRNVDFCTYGFLNATEDFITKRPKVAQVVVNAYEHARAWAAANQAETAKILAKEAALSEEIATKVISERSNLDVDPVPGAKQNEVLAKVAPIFVTLGDVKTETAVNEALNTIIHDAFVKAADPAAIK